MCLTDIGNEEMQRSIKLCTRKTNSMSTSTRIISNVSKNILFVVK